MRTKDRTVEAYLSYGEARIGITNTWNLYWHEYYSKAGTLRYRRILLAIAAAALIQGKEAADADPR